MRMFKRKGDMEFAVKLAESLRSNRCPHYEAAVKAANYYNVNCNAVAALMGKKARR